MDGLPLIDPATAGPDAAEALRKAAEAFGGATPNLTRVMANSPAALHGYLDFAGALEHGVLEPGVRERIALLVADQNGCGYCLSAHTYIAQRVLQLPEDETAAARRGGSSDPRIRALLGLASAVNLGRGSIEDGLVEAVRGVGVSDSEIAEVVAHVAANAFTNYFAKTARVDIDFPRITPLGGAA